MPGRPLFAAICYPHPLPAGHRSKPYPAEWPFVSLAGEQTRSLLGTRARTAGNVGWPRTLRGASAGHSSRTGRNTTGRPSRASCRPPGTTTRHARALGDQPLHRATCRHSPGRVITAVRSLPRPRPSRPVDTKSACPLSVLPSPRAPPSHLNGVAVQAVGRN